MFGHWIGVINVFVETHVWFEGMGGDLFDMYELQSSLTSSYRSVMALHCTLNEVLLIVTFS